MRKQVVSLIVATMVGSVAVVVLSSPAHAEPCNGSSWKEDVNTQTVAYRNCAPNGSVRLRGWIKGGTFGYQQGSCVTIPAQGSRYLMRTQPTFSASLLPWGVKGC